MRHAVISEIARLYNARNARMNTLARRSTNDVRRAGGLIPSLRSVATRARDAERELVDALHEFLPTGEELRAVLATPDLVRLGDYPGLRRLPADPARCDAWAADIARAATSRAA